MRTIQQFVTVQVSAFYSPLLGCLEQEEIKANLPNQEFFNVGWLLPESLLMPIQGTLDGFPL
jgi:hypothetical protein